MLNETENKFLFYCINSYSSNSMATFNNIGAVEMLNE